MDHYAVVGHPVSHSKSPRIHSQFAKLTGQSLEYTALQAPIDGFAHTVQGFFERGGRGLNVTVPFKEEAWRLCAERSERASLAGAVNTLWFSADGHLCGDNTDGAGLVRDLHVNHHIATQASRILILGAGGAVRGVLGPLLTSRPSSIVIANRTPEKAQQLAELFDDHIPVTGVGFTDIDGRFDLVINGTSASLNGDMPPLPEDLAHPDLVAYDMMYSAEATIFNRWMAERGVETTLDGLGMLVEQAAEAFFVWRGIRPPTAPVLAALRQD